jgi:hypothetical protein
MKLKTVKMMIGCFRLSKRINDLKQKVWKLHLTYIVNFNKNINELNQDDFLMPEDEDEEFEESPSINQIGTDNGGGYTNMLDKWMTNL